MKKILIFLIVMNIIISTRASEYWNFYKEPYQNIQVGNFSAPRLADIDGDNDLDLFIGKWDATLAFYKNVGSSSKPSFKLINDGTKSSFANFRSDFQANVFFVDIDDDGDLDMFAGSLAGYIKFVRNVGNAKNPRWQVVKTGESEETSYNRIYVGKNSVPVFCDIDNDGDQDMFIGEYDGYINFYKNDGSSKTPSWLAVNDAKNSTGSYQKITVSALSVPVFVDIDRDGDLDLFVGSFDGTVAFYQNEGNARNPNFALVNDGKTRSTSYENIKLLSDIFPAIGDINNDGKYDFLLGNISGGVYLMQGVKIPPSQKLIQHAEDTTAGVEKAQEFTGFQPGLVVDTSVNPEDQVELLDQKTKEDKFTKLFKKGKNLAEAKKPLEALYYMNQATKYKPDDKDLKKIVRQLNREVDKMIEGLSGGQFFDEVRGNMVNGINSYKNHQLDKAQAEFRKVIETDPGNKKAKELLNLTIEKQKQEANAEKAAKLFEKAEKLRVAADLNKALDIYKKILEIYPGHDAALAAKKKVEKEIAEAASTAEVENLKKEANRLYSIKDYRGAIGKWEKVLEINPTDEAIRRKLDKARAELESSKRHSESEMIQTLLAKGKELERKKDWMGANLQYKKIKKIKSTFPGIDDMINRTAMALKKAQEQASVKKVDPNAKKQSIIHYKRGLKFYSMGNVQKALEEFEACYKLDPTNTKAKNNIKIIKKKLGK